ncbi:lambda family phage tail tape measure protein [Rhodovulum bhavnagarense]|uniref:Lambda family phage tail tape measure protein n=1 Tax=Rhodovulum bhavnagarense TaxID=992286 RepID=A0A4R2RH48_9RHOB|nr:phage tail tape measure protein [Rhodovulum bhavnagarense]TCP61928.1 lambda family phage tail tape measure protein [Rhodovulum bhavnagarense]
MAVDEDIDGFAAQVEALESTLEVARGTTTAFDLELLQMRKSLTLTNAEVGSLSRSIGRDLRSAFDGLVFDGVKLSDTLRDLASSILDATYSVAVKPVQDRLGGLVAGGIEGLIGAAIPFEKGSAFTQGRVMPFADGGVVRRATYFPMRGGSGLMGEAGPEAILPLARGADGRLGVSSGGGGRPIQVTMNISTPDAESFSRSRSQIAAEMGRALARGQRNR